MSNRSKVLRTLLVLGIVACIAGAGVFSAFSSQTENPGNVITAGTVTCFLAAYRQDQVFTISLAVWVVAGVVSLAAITGGVALIGRLAQLQTGDKDEVESS